MGKQSRKRRAERRTVPKKKPIRNGLKNLAEPTEPKDVDADIAEIPNELEAGLNQEGLTLETTESEPKFDAQSILDEMLKKYGT